MPSVPTTPAIETSLAAAGPVRRADRRASIARSSAGARGRGGVPLAAGVARAPAAAEVGGQPDRRRRAGRRRRARERSVRPRAVTASDAGTPSWVCPPSTGTPVGVGGRRAGRARTRRGERRVAGADGVEQADGRGAHRGEVVDVDEHRAPAGPLGVALDHRGQDRVARGDQVACPAPGRRRRRRSRRRARRSPASELAERRPWSRRRGRRTRPIGQRMRTCGRPGDRRVAAAGCQPRRREEAARSRAWTVGVEAQRAARPRRGRRRRAPARRRPRPAAAAPRGDDEPAAAPPAEVAARRSARARAGRRRAPSPCAVAGDEHDRARVVVVRRRGRARVEQALLVDERPSRRSAPVGGDVGAASIAGASAIGRRADGGARGRRGSRRRRSGRRAAVEDRHGPQPPAADSAEHAPHAAQPAPWSAPRMPAATQDRGDARGDVGEQLGVRRGDAVGERERARRAGGTGRRTGRRRASISSRGAGDQLVGVLAEADEEVGRDPVAAEDADGLVPGRLGTRPAARDALPGIQRARTSSSSDSTWMPIAVGAGVAQLLRCTARSPRRLALHLDRQARHRRADRADAAGEVAGAAVAAVASCRWSSPSAATPSRRTAASATSASCAGRLHRGRGAGAQRLPRSRRTGSARASS